MFIFHPPSQFVRFHNYNMAPRWEVAHIKAQIHAGFISWTPHRFIQLSWCLVSAILCKRSGTHSSLWNALQAPFLAARSITIFETTKKIPLTEGWGSRKPGPASQGNAAENIFFQGEWFCKIELQNNALLSNVT